MTLQEQLAARIAELTQQRQQFVEQANQQLAATNGAIAELERLLKSQIEQPEKETP